MELAGCVVVGVVIIMSTAATNDKFWRPMHVSLAQAYVQSSVERITQSDAQTNLPMVKLKNVIAQAKAKTNA